MTFEEFFLNPAVNMNQDEIQEINEPVSNASTKTELPPSRIYDFLIF